MIVEIADDFDLEKIANSGQCFRVRKFDTECKNPLTIFSKNGSEKMPAVLVKKRGKSSVIAPATVSSKNPIYRFVTLNNVLCIRQTSSCETLTHQASSLQTSASIYEVSCTRNDWQNIWVPYFDLRRNYRKIRESVPASDKFMRMAAEAGRGIRILRQDPWEMLLTFITSQRKSIPAIQSSVEQMCEKFGSVYKPHDCNLHLFPTPAQMQNATLDDLKACKLGYRAPYIQNATRAVFAGDINLDALQNASDEDLLTSLMRIKGVGIKVANCVALFAYGRVGLAPVDTWIQKIIDTHYSGENPFPAYGNVAGIMQQYAFWWAQQNKSAF